MSMWSDFVYETRGIDVVENDMGFASFIIKGKECYIEDVYVKPQFRNKNVASELVDEIRDRALRVGCTFLTTTINLIITDPTSSAKVIIAYGFKISHAHNGVICFKKEI